jgi:hypothetical protein
VLRIPPPDLTRIAQRRGGNFPDAEIAAQIDGRTVVPAHGSRDMPIWGQRWGNSSAAATLAKSPCAGIWSSS